MTRMLGMVAVAGMLVVAAAATGAGAGANSISISISTSGSAAELSEAAGAVAVQDTAGKAIFEGKGTCFACHGQNAKGTALAPDLTDGEWLNVDGSLEQITELIKTGVPNPKQFPAPMPAMGGAQLTEAEVQAVAQYVVSLSAGGGDV